MRTRKSQREYNQETIDFIEHNKNQPIRESKKEKQEYIQKEVWDLNDQCPQLGDVFEYERLFLFMRENNKNKRYIDEHIERHFNHNI